MIQAFRQAQTGNQKILEGVRSAFLLFNLVACPLYLVEISLLGHWLDSWESRWPYLAMLLGFIATALILVNRKPGGIRTFFLVVMAFLAVTGVAGSIFHLLYNFGGEVSWAAKDTMDALEGERPVLAPLAFAHIGLVGLLCLYKAD